MRCPNHSQNDVAGFCVVCGDLGCSECLSEYEGNLYCARDFRPIAQKIEQVKRQETNRKKPTRQRLVVRFANGDRKQGICLALNPREAGFHLDLVDANCVPIGETVPVRFQDIKAVFQVKSFDGNFDKTVRYREGTPEGQEVVVRFKDGEVVRGFSPAANDRNELRFHLIPRDSNTNNISILVEQSAVDRVFSPEEYEQVLAEERKSQAAGSDDASLSQEETTGDFYFETRNYGGAYEQYVKAAQKYPQVRRIQRKILICQYNMGIQHIKRREYDKALKYMEVVLKSDPRNERVHKKVSQLRHIINKGAGGLNSGSDPLDD